MAVLCLLVIVSPFLLLWGWWALGLVRAPRSRSLAREAGRALMLAAAPALLVAGVVVAAYFVARDVRRLADVTAARLIVPVPAALAATAAGAVLAAAVALRLRRPPPAPDADDPLLPSDRLLVPWSLGALVTVGTLSLTLGLWNHGEWWLTGAGVGLALLPVVVLLQRLVLWLHERRAGPPSPRRLVAWTVLPLLVPALPLLGWTVHGTRPRVLLRDLLGAPLPDGITDVRVDERHFFVLEGSWYLSFRWSPEALKAWAEAHGFTSAAAGRWVRSSRGQAHRFESLTIDPTGRVQYTWFVGID